MLWNLIFEFYVKYIFGGYFDGESYYAKLGDCTWLLGNGTIDDSSPIGTYDVGGIVIKSDFLGDYNFGLCLGNYLSLIATIITMIIILLIIGHFIKKAFNLFGRII